MNRDDERKRRFNEGIVNLLYPPSPQPQLQQDPEPVQALNLIEGSGSGSVDVISGSVSYIKSNAGSLYDNENASTSGDEEEQHVDVNLTRSQRKKIRKKKLKEEAMRRGNLIGPLLPLSSSTATTQCADQVAVLEDAPSVRSNASEEGDDEPACAKSKKLKHRRMAKGMAKDKRVSVSKLESCNQGSISSSVVGLKAPHS
ncbi:uncharacterized protein LOC130735856 [Lotus japonicus]|uniref:uncharacterized protein LOC130735856 n=1 Tax=Lotus japonicus TaxID=34305 RepID=UPI002582FFD0|nr:uncharacterized protein LOC130735856 [Lotus japonicus]